MWCLAGSENRVFESRRVHFFAFFFLVLCKCKLESMLAKLQEAEFPYPVTYLEAIKRAVTD